jgi:integrase
MKVEFKYVQWVLGRHGKRFHYYRRNGWRKLIRDNHDRPVGPREKGFTAAWELLNAEYERLAQAEAEALVAMPAEKRASVTPGTLAHLIEDYLASELFAEKAERTREGYRRICEVLKEKVGDVPVRDINREFVVTIRNQHAKSKRAADARVQMLSILISHAMETPARFRLPGSYQHNPAYGVRKLKNKKNTQDYRPWPQDVFDDIVNAATTALRRFIIATRHTGQRGGDVAGMKLTDYENGEVRVKQDKTDARVWIPATPELVALIAENPKDNVLLFPNSRGRKWEASAWGSEIRKLMKKTGHEGYSLHGLRKNATIELLEAGCTPDEVKAITGHITTQMIEKYGREVSKRRQAKAAIVKLTDAKKNKG